MRRSMLAVLGLLGVAGAAQAAQPLVWQGTVFVTGITAPCEPGGTLAVGDYGTMVYRPIIRPSQVANEALTYVTPRNGVYVVSETASKTLRGTGTFSEYVISSRANGYSTAGGFALTISPATITAATATVSISGTIDNIFDVAGCTATLSGNLVKRID